MSAKESGMCAIRQAHAAHTFQKETDPGRYNSGTTAVDCPGVPIDGGWQEAAVEAANLHLAAVRMSNEANARALHQAHLLRDLCQRLDAWIRHGEAVPDDVTTYERSTVHEELRTLLEDYR